MVVDSARRGRSLVGCGRGFRSCIPCQICGQSGHLAQRCYYHFNRDCGGPASGARVSSSSSFVNQGSGVLYAAVPAPMSISSAGLPSMVPQLNFPNGWWGGL